jgi:two-component system response regulator HydG
MNSGPVIHVIDLGTSLQSMRPAAASSPSNGAATLAELEKRAILDTLQRTHGDKLKAADLLGIGKTTLYRKLKEYGPQF